MRRLGLVTAIGATLSGAETLENKTISKSNVLVSVNAQTADYTLVLADAGKLIDMDKATAVTLTVPTNASVAFPIGTLLMFRQKGAGQLTIAGAGVTLQSAGGELKTRAQFSLGSLVKLASDTWAVGGDLGV